MRALPWRQRQGLVGLLATLASPLLLAYIAWRRLGRRPLVGVGTKLTGRTSLPPTTIRPLLIHGVSLGEVALMRPLVPALERELARPCLLTTTTETGWQGLAKHFPDHPRTFFPFDLPWAVERFLSETRPAAVILLEAEFWPVWLGACHRRGIPVALVNARVSPRSFTRFLSLRPFVQPLLAAYAVVAAQNGTYAARLHRLGCAKAVPCGSLKADMVTLASPAQIAAEGARTGLIAQRPVLLIASTSVGEEALVLAAWPARADWTILICPRHPERGGELVDLCRSHGLHAARTSLGQHLDDREVLIVDEIGRLGALYGWCAQTVGIAIVGGSLGSGRGGQNMLEAAAARCATVVGWDTRSQPDSMHLLRACGGVVEMTSDNLAAELAALAADPARRAQLGAAGHAAWHAGQGAAARVVRLLARDLAPLLLRS
jgi:3-deoxy-D-manno-octulosonic-acid transferase